MIETQETGTLFPLFQQFELWDSPLKESYIGLGEYLGEVKFRGTTTSRYRLVDGGRNVHGIECHAEQVKK